MPFGLSAAARTRRRPQHEQRSSCTSARSNTARSARSHQDVGAMGVRCCLQAQSFVSSRLQQILILFAFLLQFVWCYFYHLLSPSLPTATFLYSGDINTIDHNNTIYLSSSPGEFLRSSSTTINIGSSFHLRPRTIYLEFAWTNLHSEIFYSLIREFCGTFVKDVAFVVDENVAFYLGPPHRITPPALEIWREFNASGAACGPIYIDTPSSPDLIVLTTTYAHPTFTREFIAHNVNNSKFLIICHDDNPEMEEATNVFWLTPLHSNYFIPNFFPPSFVARRKKQSLKRREEAKSAGPVFLVLGKATPRKRNIQSLLGVLRHYRHEKFRLRIMGKTFPPIFNRSMYCKQQWCDKIEYFRLPNPLDFMLNVTAADVILPLVDETNFYTTYQGGKKLSSSVMWAQSFGIPMILYRELAYVYNARDDGSCIHDEHPSQMHLVAQNVTHVWPRSRRPLVTGTGDRNLRTFSACFGKFIQHFKGAHVGVGDRNK